MDLQAMRPTKRRAPPTYLSGLSPEAIVERRNRMAREYSRRAHGRREAAMAMLEQDVAALRVAREAVEGAARAASFILRCQATCAPSSSTPMTAPNRC